MLKLTTISSLPTDCMLKHTIISSLITDWMLKLRTVYPFGLNDRIGDEYMTESGNIIISNKFPSLKRHNKHSRSRTKNRIGHDLIISHFPYIVME